MASVSDDGYVRLYDTNFNLLKKVQPSGGKEPFSLAFSPDSDLLAVGFYDSPTIQVLDGNQLTLRYEPDITGAKSLNDRLDKVLFSKDGKQLIAGGVLDSYQSDGKWWRNIRIWDNQGKGSYSDFPVAGNTIMDLKLLPNENIIFGGALPDWGILDPDSGKKIVYHGSEINDYRKSDLSHFKINENAQEIGWTPAYENPLTFDLENRILSSQSSNLPSFQDNNGSLQITQWEDTRNPLLHGEPFSFLEKYETSRSIDISNDSKSMVFGGDWNLYGLNREGKQIWKTATQSTAWAVNIAGNNKIVAACVGDGTIRWYRMEDGQQLLTLFVHPDRKRWILWTPSGYYDASSGGEDLIGWHVNQGEDSEALYYPASRFRDTYYRPGVIDRILETLDEEEAIQQANSVANKNTTVQRTILNELPPSIKILNPTTGTTVKSNEVQLEYSIKSPDNEPVTGIKVLIDGRPIKNERGLTPAGKRGSIAIEIPSRNCTVSMIAENRFGASPESSINLVWQGQLQLSLKPNLYIMAVGVSDYDDDKFDLDYPDDDARAFVEALKKQEGLLYNEVVTKLYTDQTATKDNILDGLDWLVKETTQHDVAMLFFAGHGVEDTRGTFYYLPVGADENAMRRTCLMEADVQETVSVVAGKIVVFMDACHSGNLMLASSRRGGNPDINRIVNELRDAENGAVVFSSSTGRQSSLEDPEWKHGAFTLALIEGLTGKANMGDGKVSCKSLDLYVSRRVKQLTGGQQTPTTNYPPNVPDFPIAIKN